MHDAVAPRSPEITALLLIADIYIDIAGMTAGGVFAKQERTGV
jgi:hypothetical protein